MRRRLLVVADAFYPVMGGSTRVIAESSRALVRRGYEVRVLVGGRDLRLPRAEVWDGVEIIRYPVSPRNTVALNVTGIVGAARAAVRTLAERRFDLVDGHDLYGPLGARLSPSARAVPMVATCHGPLHREFEVSRPSRLAAGGVVRRALEPAFARVYSRWLRLLQGRVLADAVRCVVLSRYAESFVREVKPSYPMDRLRIVPGGVDVERFRPATDRTALRRRLGLPERSPLLVTIRRLVPRMGLLPLVDAMAEVTARCPDAQLVIGGEGELAGVLRERIAYRGLTGRVTLAGFVPDESLPGYYQSADLCLLPSTSLEGFGLVTVEALACGTPVLASRTAGGSVEVLGQLGDELLVDEPSAPALAAGVLRFLDSHLDDVGFRGRCRALGEDYSWTARARRLEALHDEVLSETGSVATGAGRR